MFEIWHVAGCVVTTGFITYFIGKKLGWNAAVAMFRQLQDDGELIVLTLAQSQEAELEKVQGVIYNEDDAGDPLLDDAEKEPIPGVPEKRPRSETRKKRWAHKDDGEAEKEEA